MIAKLKGVLDSILEDSLIIDVHGVGYEVRISESIKLRLPSIGESLVLFVQTVVRQDETYLCGFLEELHKRYFNILLSVQGVGVRVALGILSSLTPDQIYNIIMSGDKNSLVKADGVGPKLAGRLILELKEKLPYPDSNSDTGIGVIQESSLISSENNSMNNDAVMALQGLGYSKSDAFRVVQQVNSKHQNIELSQMLKLCLQKLNK
ncbi:MAG: Holliday junction branch migration protein RuvA [Candidatus Puniceispirillum sp.]|nr:Holliday junction branch migration protein RuvA [Candidatus Pelagibacter sp.]MBA4283087.1 Holliday junction branch migration protein RuvA [Candidatus Puniceispirillum sp.]